MSEILDKFIKEREIEKSLFERVQKLELSAPKARFSFLASYFQQMVCPICGMDIPDKSIESKTKSNTWYNYYLCKHCGYEHVSGLGD